MTKRLIPLCLAAAALPLTAAAEDDRWYVTADVAEMAGDTSGKLIIHAANCLDFSQNCFLRY